VYRNALACREADNFDLATSMQIVYRTRSASPTAGLYRWHLTMSSRAWGYDVRNILTAGYGPNSS